MWSDGHLTPREMKGISGIPPPFQQVQHEHMGAVNSHGRPHDSHEGVELALGKQGDEVLILPASSILEAFIKGRKASVSP